MTEQITQKTPREEEEMTIWGQATPADDDWKGGRS
jgi:hypothetical protein